MNDKYTDYLEKLINRFDNYKSPNETQQLILALGKKTDRTDDDDKKLMILLKAEKKVEELQVARQKTRELLNEEKKVARNLENRKKFIWGSALKTAAKTDIQAAVMMRKLFDSGFIDDRDKDAVKADYDALTAHQDSSF